MATFIIGLVILVVGAFLYGKLCEKVFGPDDRQTPAYIKQASNAKRLGLSTIIFALVAVILVFAKTNAQGFNILCRYFAWSNQTLSLFAFACIAVWMFLNGKAKWAWMPPSLLKFLCLRIKNLVRRHIYFFTCCNL